MTGKPYASKVISVYYITEGWFKDVGSKTCIYQSDVVDA